MNRSWLLVETITIRVSGFRVAGGRQSGAMLFSPLGVMGNEDGGTGPKSSGSASSQTGSGYSTDMSEDHLGQEPTAGSSLNSESQNSDSDEQVSGTPQGFPEEFPYCCLFVNVMNNNRIYTAPSTIIHTHSLTYEGQHTPPSFGLYVLLSLLC